ncbi:MAG: hypothetical protein CMJ34_00300 [Phycisphaerae bacterium]|nr:hypothetical protein [Phycisphaerae bacterium]
MPVDPDGGDDAGPSRSPREWMPMTGSRPTDEMERLKAKYHVEALHRWDHRRRMGILLSFLACLAYVVIALFNGWKLAPGSFPAWCFAPMFVCGTPFLIFVLSGFLAPGRRVGILESVFRDRTELEKAMSEIGRLARETSGVPTVEDRTALDEALEFLSGEMDKAKTSGADRFEIWEHVSATIRNDLSDDLEVNREIEQVVSAFLDERRP